VLALTTLEQKTVTADDTKDWHSGYRWCGPYTSVKSGANYVSVGVDSYASATQLEVETTTDHANFTNRLTDAAATVYSVLKDFGGTLYLVYSADDAGTRDVIRIRTSADDGVTWSAATDLAVAADSRVVDVFQLGGTLWIAYEDVDPAGADVSVTFTKTDGTEVSSTISGGDRYTAPGYVDGSTYYFPQYDGTDTLLRSFDGSTCATVETIVAGKRAIPSGPFFPALGGMVRVNAKTYYISVYEDGADLKYALYVRDATGWSELLSSVATSTLPAPGPMFSFADGYVPRYLTWLTDAGYQDVYYITPGGALVKIYTGTSALNIGAGWGDVLDQAYVSGVSRQFIECTYRARLLSPRTATVHVNATDIATGDGFIVQDDSDNVEFIGHVTRAPAGAGTTVLALVEPARADLERLVTESYTTKTAKYILEDVLEGYCRFLHSGDLTIDDPAATYTKSFTETPVRAVLDWVVKVTQKILYWGPEGDVALDDADEAHDTAITLDEDTITAFQLAPEGAPPNYVILTGGYANGALLKSVVGAPAEGALAATVFRDTFPEITSQSELDALAEAIVAGTAPGNDRVDLAFGLDQLLQVGRTMSVAYAPYSVSATTVILHEYTQDRVSALNTARAFTGLTFGPRPDTGTLQRDALAGVAAAAFLANGSRDLAGDLVPDADNTRDVGSATDNFAEVHAREVVSNAGLVVDCASGNSVDIKVNGTSKVTATATNVDLLDDVDCNGNVVVNTGTITAGSDNSEDVGSAALNYAEVHARAVKSNDVLSLTGDYVNFAQPACVVTRSSAWTHTSTGNYQACPFNDETEDYLVMHDNTTNNTRVTVPVAGWYHVTFSIYWSAAPGTCVLDPRVNGTTVQQYEHLGNAQYGHVSWLLKLGASDYVEMWVAQVSGGNLATSATIFPVLKLVRVAASSQT
jgi:hypothetical protein